VVLAGAVTVFADHCFVVGFAPGFEFVLMAALAGLRIDKLYRLVCPILSGISTPVKAE